MRAICDTFHKEFAFNPGLICQRLALAPQLTLDFLHIFVSFPQILMSFCLN